MASFDRWVTQFRDLLFKFRFCMWKWGPLKMSIYVFENTYVITAFPFSKCMQYNHRSNVSPNHDLIFPSLTTMSWIILKHQILLFLCTYFLHSISWIIRVLKELTKYLVKPQVDEKNNASSERIYSNCVLSLGFPALLAALDCVQNFQFLSKYNEAFLQYKSLEI